MIWNPKKHPRAPSSDVESAPEPVQAPVTLAMRKNLVALIAQTAQGVSSNITAREHGIVCALGSTEAGPEAEARFDHYGLIRELSVAKPDVSLFRLPYTGDALVHAQSYVSQPTVQRAFRLQHVQLAAEEPVDYDFGKRVPFKQMIAVKTADGIKQFAVRGGTFNVMINNDGRTTNVGSTVRHGEKPRTLGKIISQEEAIAKAKAETQMPDAKVLSVVFEFSAHEGKLDPTYAVKLTNVALLGVDDEVSVIVDTAPITPKFVEVLLHAKTGDTLHIESLLRHSQVNRKQKVLNNPLARVFLRVPDYKVDVLKQLFQTRLEDMPDPKVLKDEVFKMFTLENSRWQLVKPNGQGNYEFAAGSNASSAVIAYYPLTQMRKRFEKLGFRAVRTPIPVKVNDPQTPDNAFMVPDLNQPEMHIGVGTGVEGGGLTKMIVYCIDVEWHELFHWLITIQTPGNDLTGAEGAAMHEGLSDIAAWLFGWLFLLANATVLGVTVTRQDIANDLRKIGEFCMPPNGIRQQLNKKKVKDKTGEPHDDGEIIGGAVSDFFAGFIENSKGELVDAIETCVKMMAQMLAVMPAKRPLFTDALRGLISADLNENKGVNRAAIEKAFKGHDIVLTGGNPPSKKRPRKKRKAA